MARQKVKAATRFGRLLDRAMKQEGIESVSELARRTGGQVSCPYLCMLRKGRRSSPSTDAVMAIVHALKGNETMFQEFCDALHLVSPDYTARLAVMQELRALSVSIRSHAIGLSKNIRELEKALRTLEAAELLSSRK